MCLRKHEAVQGFLIDFHCSGADNIFIIIIWQNIINPGERERERDVKLRKGKGLKLESRPQVKFLI